MNTGLCLCINLWPSVVSLTIQIIYHVINFRLKMPKLRTLLIIFKRVNIRRGKFAQTNAYFYVAFIRRIQTKVTTFYLLMNQQLRIFFIGIHLFLVTQSQINELSVFFQWLCLCKGSCFRANISRTQHRQIRRHNRPFWCRYVITFSLLPVCNSGISRSFRDVWQAKI
jgi:hypothetical protein